MSVLDRLLTKLDIACGGPGSGRHKGLMSKRQLASIDVARKYKLRFLREDGNKVIFTRKTWRKGKDPFEDTPDLDHQLIINPNGSYVLDTAQNGKGDKVEGPSAKYLEMHLKERTPSDLQAGGPGSGRKPGYSFLYKRTGSERWPEHRVTIKYKGKKVGGIHGYQEKDGNVRVEDAQVEEEHQGQGLAQDAYKHLFKNVGPDVKSVSSGTSMMKTGHKLWKSMKKKDPSIAEGKDITGKARFVKQIHAGGPGSGRHKNWATDKEKELYEHDSCWEYAVGLHEHTGYPLAVLRVGANASTSDADEGDSVHAFIAIPPGKPGSLFKTAHDTYVDIGGRYTKQQMIDKYGGKAELGDAKIETAKENSKVDNEVYGFCFSKDTRREAKSVAAKQVANLGIVSDVKAGGPGSGRKRSVEDEIGKIKKKKWKNQTDEERRKVALHDKRQMKLFDKITSSLEAGGPGSGRHVDPLTEERKLLKHEANLAKLRKQAKLARAKLAKSGVSARGTEIVSEKAKRALANVSSATKEHQDLAEEVEKHVAAATKGEKQPDNSPFDVVAKDSKGRKHGIEVKALLYQKNDKITIKGKALQRKLDFAKKNKLYKIHTVGVDYRTDKDKPIVFHKEGVGAFRIGSMSTVKHNLRGLAAHMNLK